MTESQEPGKGGLEIVGEAMHIIRATPPEVLMSYYIGSAPLVLGLLYFWAEMSVGAFASARCVPASLGLAALFVWMKCWQAVFAAGIRAMITGKPAEPWTTVRVLRLIRTQTSLQPYGLILIPLALLVTIPFATVLGFYQNLTVIDTDDEERGKHIAGRAWKLALMWQKQSHVMIWLVSPWALGIGMSAIFASLKLAQSMDPGTFATEGLIWFIFLSIATFSLTALLCPFGAMVAGNIAVMLALLPWILKTIAGMDTTFTISGPGAIINTTFLTTVFGLSYLCLDPVFKTAYTLRCFLGDSQKTGEDLIVELRASSLPARKSARQHSLLLPLVLAVLASMSLPAFAAVPAKPAPPSKASPSRPELDLAIDNVLERPEYSWRMPRQAADKDQQGFIATFISDLTNWIESRTRSLWHYLEKFGAWLDSLFRSRDRSSQQTDGQWSNWPSAPLAFLLVCLALSAGTLGVVLLRMWRRRHTAAITIATPASVKPDIRDENTSAADLPPDEWREMASEFLERGEYRLAIRALFLATLARLAHNDRITLTRYKSNRDYTTELRRKAHDLPPLTAAFTGAVRILEKIWYGEHTATAETATCFSDTIVPIFEDRNADQNAT